MPTMSLVAPPRSSGAAPLLPHVVLVALVGRLVAEMVVCGGSVVFGVAAAVVRLSVPVARDYSWPEDHSVRLSSVLPPELPGEERLVNSSERRRQQISRHSRSSRRTTEERRQWCCCRMVDLAPARGEQCIHLFIYRAIQKTRFGIALSRALLIMHVRSSGAGAAASRPATNSHRA